MTPWGEYLQQLMDERDLKPAACARLLRVSHPFLRRIMHGEPHTNAETVYRPPLDRLDQWAESLSLSESERARFVELAETEHAPARLAQRYREAMARLAYLEQALARLRQGER